MDRYLFSVGFGHVTSSTGWEASQRLFFSLLHMDLGPGVMIWWIRWKEYEECDNALGGLISSISCCNTWYDETILWALHHHRAMVWPHLVPDCSQRKLIFEKFWSQTSDLLPIVDPVDLVESITHGVFPDLRDFGNCMDWSFDAFDEGEAHNFILYQYSEYSVKLSWTPSPSLNFID